MSEGYQDELFHYGILRRSGRYPWGSGKDPYQRSLGFYGAMEELKAKGFSQKEIAESLGMTIAELRSTTTIAKEERIAGERAQIQRMRDKGMSPKAIADAMDMPLATVQLRLKPGAERTKTSLRNTAEVVRDAVEKHGIVDVGKGTELHMGISKERLAAAVALLRDEGYETYTLPIRQPGTKQFTKTLVVVPEGTGFGGSMKLQDKIHTMAEYTIDDGLTYFGIHEPLSISSSRLKVNFAEDGGTDADGVVYIRPGVSDLDMGKNTYAQVRIAIDGTHYIKGMAVLNPDMPDGVDLVFNTNKSREVGKLGALKPLKNDSDNPFGSQIKRQIVDIDPKTGKERVKSAINLVNEEGDWEDWRKSIPSQMLAKQPHSLIKSQLKLTREEVAGRIAEINEITNPVVKKKRLESLADEIDADAVDLRAAAMPKQRTQVIIPMPHLRPQEIYAPNFENGERVVLIRYPHGGKFEIPEVTVNNNSRKAKSLLGRAADAIGIHPSVAEKLSGADFDGDTVIVIPNKDGRIKGSDSMPRSSARVYEQGLKNFDPKTQYGGYEVVQPAKGKKGEPGYVPEKGNFKLMKNTGMEMGMITNLITDMSIQGAKDEHIVRAVRHSMVVIDAEKHKLNYKQSEIDNNIAQLKELYQGSSKSGAKTLLSKATAKVEIDERKLRTAPKGGAVDPETGKLMYEPTNRMKSKYDSKTQTYLEEKVPVKEKVKRLALTDDAYSLVYDKANPVERLYADHANEMKALANKTRLMALKTPNPPLNTKARAVYKDHVDDLVRQLREVEKQKPLDRKAQQLANQIIKQKRAEDPTLRVDLDRKKKVERQARQAARDKLGLKKLTIEISDTQWDAIQAGAVSSSRLRKILDAADPKRIEELSTPRKNTVMTKPVLARAKALLATDKSNAEVAAALGISVSTLRAAIQRGEI